LGARSGRGIGFNAGCLALPLALFRRALTALLPAALGLAVFAVARRFTRPAFVRAVRDFFRAIRLDNPA